MGIRALLNLPGDDEYGAITTQGGDTMNFSNVESVYAGNFIL